MVLYYLDLRHSLYRQLKQIKMDLKGKNQDDNYPTEDNELFTVIDMDSGGYYDLEKNTYIKVIYV